MLEHTSQEFVLQPKLCMRCKIVKSPSEFYTRSGNPHLLNSECKACMKERSRMAERKSKNNSFVPSETMAIEYLSDNGIHAVPGKAVSYADVDVVAFGCVRIEVKYSKINRNQSTERYKFVATPKQVARGFLADLVMLICDDGESRTFHIFPVDCPVFYINGRLKSAVDYIPQPRNASRRQNGRVIMTKDIMDRYKDKTGFVWDRVKKFSDNLKLAARIRAGDPFGGAADFD